MVCGQNTPSRPTDFTEITSKPRKIILPGFLLTVNIYMQNQEQADSTLKINDLELIRQVLDLAAVRGAFRANEMRSVGEVYEKLSFFLDSMQAQLNGPAVEPQQGE